MFKLKNSLLVAASLAVGISTQAQAHDAWFLPSNTVLSDTNQMVTVDAGTSTAPFEANHNAMNIDTVKVWAPDGTMGKVENAAKGRYRSTFDVKIDKPGTWRIGTENSSVSGSFKVNGEDWIVGRRRGGGGQAPGAGGQPGAQGMPGGAGAPPQGQGGAGRPSIDPSHVVASIEEIPAGATDLKLTESMSRNEFFVTASAPTDTVLKPTNKGLEFAPVTLPTDLVSNEPGQFRFLLDGKPLAGLKVEVIPGARRFRETDQNQELTTDASGLITVNWPVAGYYYLKTSHTDDKPSNPKASSRRMTYVATLEVLAP